MRETIGECREAEFEKLRIRYVRETHDPELLAVPACTFSGTVSRIPWGKEQLRTASHCDCPACEEAVMLWFDPELTDTWRDWTRFWMQLVVDRRLGELCHFQRVRAARRAQQLAIFRGKKAAASSGTGNGAGPAGQSGSLTSGKSSE